MAQNDTMPAFGYNPEAYVTNATDWANQFYGRGSDEYQWAKDQFAKNEATANQVIGSALTNAGMYDNAAAAGLSRYQNLYGPAMAQHLAFAQQMGSEPNLEMYRGRAMAGVGQAYDAASANAAQALKDQGLNPKDVAARLDSSVRVKRAADQAGAGNQEYLNRQIAAQTELGKSIGLGQQDAAISNQFGGLGLANRNQAINTGTALTQTGSQTRGGPQQWGAMGANQLKEWPKAELDSMRASNEYGALWNDINRTNMAQAQAGASEGSGVGTAAGGILGALSSMVKFAPIMLAKGGVVPHYGMGGPIDPPPSSGTFTPDPSALMGMMGGGGGGAPAAPRLVLPETSTWRKFAYGNPIGNPEPLLEEGAGVAQPAAPARRGGGSPMFDFSGGAPEVFAAGPQGSGLGGQYAPEDFAPGGQYNSMMGAGWNEYAAGVGSQFKRGGAVPKRGAINTGPSIKKYYNAGVTQPSTTDSVENYSRQLSGMDPTGYAGFATDALALGRDIFDPSAQDADTRPGDAFGITGPYEVDAGEQLGGDILRPIGRFVGGMFGAPGVGAAIAAPIGEGIGAMVQGRWGEGFENIGRGFLNAGTSNVASAMKMGGGMGGGGMGGLLGGGSGMTFAGGGAVPEGPLGQLARYVNGGEVTGPVTPQFQDGGMQMPMQPGAIQTGQTVPASAQVPGIEGPDNVPAMVAEGEGILPQDFMRWRGEQWLQKEIMKARKEMQQQQVAGPEEGPTPPEAIQTGPTFASEGALT